MQVQRPSRKAKLAQAAWDGLLWKDRGDAVQPPMKPTTLGIIADPSAWQNTKTDNRAKFLTSLAITVNSGQLKTY